MTVYNGMRFLKKQIDSLLNQTVIPDIIVCCDDGSTDGSLDWLADYVRELGEERRFLLVKNEKNLGYIQNFYKALDIAEADFLFLCDQDDIWSSDKIEKMLAIFAEKPTCKLLSCAHTIIDADDNLISSLRYGQKSGSGSVTSVSEREIVTMFLWPGMTMAMRRDFYLEVRDSVKQIPAPHDRVLALAAASQSGMYFYDLALNGHRLHTSNHGGEEDSMRTYLARDFKRKELATSVKWLDAQIKHSHTFSPSANATLKGYREYVFRRLQALEASSIPKLCRALGCRGYVNPKGIIADAVTILFNK